VRRPQPQWSTSRAAAATAGSTPGGQTGSSRDEFVDLCRAFSLLVVVVWHWVFTIVRWRPGGGPFASSPLGFTNGLWILTWLLQVMPVFFFVGGYAHLQLWAKVRAAGGGYAAFVLGRVRRLLLPSLLVLAIWAAITVVVEGLFDAPWFSRAALLIVSPLWFIGVYLMLVLLAPVMIALHERWGPLAVVLMAGVALLADVARFGRGLEWAAFVNLVVVWALCHQLGFFYRTLADGPRIVLWCLAWGGLLGLAGLVLTDVYPGSMVGVPGGRISNMGPPTLCIVALCFFQVGLLMLVRPWVLERLRRPAWALASEVVNRFALPLFLFHTTGYALAFGLLYVAGFQAPSAPTAVWWLQRPIWLLLPLACTIPVILLFGRGWAGRPRRRPLADLEPAVVLDSRW
jgi:hypothetical protein